MSLGSALIYARVLKNSLEGATDLFLDDLLGVLGCKLVVVLELFKPLLVLDDALVLGKVSALCDKLTHSCDLVAKSCRKNSTGIFPGKRESLKRTDQSVFW